MFSLPPLLGGCWLHGPSCRTPWGYDLAHTDSVRPYTVEELADRAEAPHRYAYPTLEEYEAGFRLWRAMRRDGQPTHVESLVSACVKLAPLAAGLGDAARGHEDHSCPVVQAVSDLKGLPAGFKIVLAQLCNCSTQ